MSTSTVQFISHRDESENDSCGDRLEIVVSGPTTSLRTDDLHLR